jgi:HD-GYP domain-containing protein (c-di-GMP phosphodiesterase class II)
MTKLSECLQQLHQTTKALQPNLVRIAVALYDQNSGLLRTYADSSDQKNPLLWYSYPLAKSESLSHLARTGQYRVINDMQVLVDSGAPHSQALLDAGLRSSFTLPIRQGEQLLGFVFFNSSKTNDFSTHLLPQLEISAYAISLLITQERSQLETLKASMQTAVAVTHERDPETGEHLRRMTDYTQFLSNKLAPRLMLSDQYVAHLVLFASLHDIGKISIPDEILLKPGRLTPAEFEQMKSHTTSGRKIIDQLIDNHALNQLDYIDMLRDIVELHHEHWDGSGYPHGLSGEQIPLAARIIACCDAFDAITTERPYKPPMPTDEALAIIAQMRGTKLDPLCADVMLNHPGQLDRIRQQQLDAAPPLPLNKGTV